MKKTAHPLTVAMAILTALLVGGGPARAEEKPIPGSGGLDAIGPGGKPLGACPLRHTDVAVEISGFVARVTVTQVFASRFTEPVEAVYTFPLSDRAAVDAMSMRTGERTIRGEIKRREEARRIYEAARAAGPILDVASPLHAIDVERPEANRARVRLRDQAEIPNRDFVLRYAVAGDEVRSGYLAHRDGEGEGYVTFVLLPPKRVTAETAAPKEMIFVIDRSGSQAGLPLEKAKETMRWILDHMNPNDTFQVVAFGNTANVLFPTPQPASPEMKRQARAHIDALEANGGTMMAEAVRTVCALPADANRLRVVTFMTDGYIGNDFEVIDLVRSLRGTSRWFSFGAGNGVNRFLLEGLARAGGGEVDYILLNDAAEAVAKRFYERIAAPALTDVRLEFRGLDVVDVFPTAPSDVWDRRPLIVHARYRRPGEGHVVLSGFRQWKPYKQVIDVTLPARATGNGAIASMWARAKVDDLMWQDLAGLQSGTFPEALREEIVQTALGHRLMTQFTSFVAVEDRVVNEGGTQRTVSVPVEMPQGVRYDGIFGGAAANAAEGRLNAAPVPMFAKSAGVAPESLTLQRSFAAYDRDASAETSARRPVPVRLAPELQALVEGAPSPGRPVRVIDGRVQVKVLLRNTHALTLHRLEAAGLRLNQVAARYVVGSVEVARLAALAALDGVERVELP